MTRYLLLLPLLIGLACAHVPSGPVKYEYEDACQEDIMVGDYLNGKISCDLCAQYRFSAPCYNGLGLVEIEIYKNLDKAEEYFNKALKRDSDFLQALNNIAFVYFARQDYEISIQYLEKVLKLDPSYEDARANLIYMLISMGEMDRAEQEAKKLKVLDNEVR